jgi:hypothetical protein
VTHATPEGIPAGDGGAPAVGWRGWSAGSRVVVRRRLPDGGLGDVLGDLLEVSDDGVVVATRRGPVRVAGADIVLGKPVPPPPPRRAPRGHHPGDDASSGRDDAGTGDDGHGGGHRPG